MLIIENKSIILLYLIQLKSFQMLTPVIQDHKINECYILSVINFIITIVYLFYYVFHRVRK